MKNFLKLALGAVGVVIASTVYAASCQIDNSTLTFTGNTKVEMGKLLKEYRCPLGHVYWMVN